VHGVRQEERVFAIRDGVYVMKVLKLSYCNMRGVSCLKLPLIINTEVLMARIYAGLGIVL